MSLQGFSYTTCDFARNKTEKKYEVSQTFKNKTLNCQCDWQISALFQTATQKSRIGLLHRNRFAEGIQLSWTIISQIYRKKKICLKSANDTIIYRLSLWYKQWKVKVAYSTMQHDTTLDAPKTFEWHPKQSSNKSFMSSTKEEIQNASEQKPIKTNDHPVENQLRLRV